MSEVTMQVNIRVLRAFARHIAARRDIRFYLESVRVEPYNGGTIYSATDGHIMARWYESETANPDLPRTLLHAADLRLIAAPKKGALSVDTVGRLPDGRWLIADRAIRVIEVGKMFDLTKSVAAYGSGAVAQFNPAYPVRIARALREIRQNVGTKDYQCSPSLRYTGESSPIIARVGSSPEFFGLIMPWRADFATDEVTIPEWAATQP